MGTKQETLKYRLPDWAGPYLINGDASGLTEQEMTIVSSFEKKLANQGIRIVSMEEDSSFYHSNDMTSQGGNCSTFIGLQAKWEQMTEASAALFYNSEFPETVLYTMPSGHWEGMKLLYYVISDDASRQTGLALLSEEQIMEQYGIDIHKTGWDTFGPKDCKHENITKMHGNADVCSDCGEVTNK